MGRRKRGGGGGKKKKEEERERGLVGEERGIRDRIEGGEIHHLFYLEGGSITYLPTPVFSTRLFITFLQDVSACIFYNVFAPTHVIPVETHFFCGLTFCPTRDKMRIEIKVKYRQDAR